MAAVFVVAAALVTLVAAGFFTAMVGFFETGTLRRIRGWSLANGGEGTPTVSAGLAAARLRVRVVTVVVAGVACLAVSKIPENSWIVDVTHSCIVGNFAGCHEFVMRRDFGRGRMREGFG